MLCGTCNAIFHSGTKCGFCKNHFCFTCSKVTEEEYGNLQPNIKAAWKCPSCQGALSSSSVTSSSPFPQVVPAHQIISYPYKPTAALSGNMTTTDLALQEIMHKLDEISSKLECLPKLVADVASLRSELRQVKKNCGLQNQEEKDSQGVECQKQHHKKKSDNRESSEKHGNTQNPFAHAPASTFDLSDFKRYFTKEEKHKSIPYFWEKFDPENYSIWFCEYKYPQELTEVFMSCNLITGMFQRLHKLRPHAFASVCVWGGEGRCAVSGVWLWRGRRLVFALHEDWQEDYTNYEWTMLDLMSKETLRLVQNYFSWSGTDPQGLPFNQGKIFK